MCLPPAAIGRYSCPHRSGADQSMQSIQPDHLGSPRVVIDATSNTPVWTWELAGEAFGATPPNQGPDGNGQPFVLNMRFPGQRYDAATGLNYNYFRDYEPNTGRCVRPSVSTYGYSSQSPMTHFDMAGRSSTAITWMNFNSEKNKARAEAIAKLRECAINDCDPKNPYKITDMERTRIMEKLVSANIVADHQAATCGVTEPSIDSNTISVASGIFIGKGCCPLPSLLAHEAAHLVFGSSLYINERNLHEGKARQIQLQCFGCVDAFH